MRKVVTNYFYFIPPNATLFIYLFNSELSCSELIMARLCGFPFHGSEKCYPELVTYRVSLTADLKKQDNDGKQCSNKDYAVVKRFFSYPHRPWLV